MVMEGDDRWGPLGKAARLLAGLGERLMLDLPLGPLTTYRVGGSAALAVRARELRDLEVVAAARAEVAFPVLVVGRGSNLLVSDGGFAGLAVLLDPARFSDLELVDEGLAAGAALSLPSLARRSVEAGLSGLEWAVGVPGSVGGGVRMNAGGHGSDMAANLASVRLIDLACPEVRVQLKQAAELELGYRKSSVVPTQVVLSARFALVPGEPRVGRATIRQIVRWRREHQPGGHNAGSVFTNPPGDSAGRLIEMAGLKGMRSGSAQVSTKHANFIQADANGSAEDVLRLIEEVARLVQARCGVTLAPELRLVGFENDSSSTTALRLSQAVRNL